MARRIDTNCMGWTYKSFASVVALATILLAGCWEQTDVISIKSDGSTTFKTDVVITEKGFSVKDIEELTSGFMKDLKSAGWQVEKKWVSRSEPFRLSFSGKGNIRKVKSASAFYRIQKINESTYSIVFIPAKTQGGRSSRTIKFEREFFGGGAKILDERGNEVKEIENVSESQTYKVVF